MVSTWCTPTFVLPLTCHLPHHSQTDVLYFFKENSSIEHSIQCPSVTMVWNKIGWKAKIERRDGEMALVQMSQAISVMRACQRLSSDDISGHQNSHENFSYELMSQTLFAAHASSPLSSVRNIGQTQESGGNQAYSNLIPRDLTEGNLCVQPPAFT